MSFLIIVAAAGITFGLQHKVAFLHKKADIIDSLLKCTYCTGFHAGWISYVIASLPSFDLQEALLYSFASAIFSYALDEAIKYLEEAGYGDDEE